MSLVEAIRNCPNKGGTHVFLGHSLSDACDKTTVEPGNTYSPGVWTFGVSVWIETEQGFFTPEGGRIREPLWTYFEAAQIHNAMLLGMKDEAWVNLEGMLDDGGGVSAYVEGEPFGNEHMPYRNDLNARGWLDPDRAQAGNMPHLWTAAELVALVRDLFVREDNGQLVLGVGVPHSWLTPGSRFGVADMPTTLGPVSYTVTVSADGTCCLDYSGPAGYRCDFGSTAKGDQCSEQQ